MSVWNVILLSGVAAAALVAWGSWRYLAWLAAIVASYGMSVAYWDAHGPYAEVVTALGDGLIVAAIAGRARYLWELAIGLLYLVSMAVSMAYLANNIVGAHTLDHVLYSSLLEAINLVAALTLGGLAAFDKAGMVNGVAFRPWLHIFGIVRPAYARRNPRS